MAVVCSSVSAQTTYTWNQTGTAAWTTSTNWTPTRTTPAVDDVLVFNNGATTIVTAVPTQTIGQLSVSGNTNVTLQTGAAGNTLTIAGGTGTDLSVAAGSQLNVNTANALIINVATGATGSISGSMTLSAGAHRLTAVDASGITFQSGATFTEGTSFSGNPFGTTNLNSIVFASGSTFIFIAGSNPFGAAQPSSVVVFQTGSLFSQTGTGTPAFSGRTYANFELNNASANVTVTGGSAVSIDNLTITAGTLNFNMTATPGHSIKGNITVASGQTLNFAPATAGTVNLNGSSAQTISGAGTLTFSTLSTINVNNANGITLQKDITINGGLTLTAGNITTGANTLSISSTGIVSRTSGHIIGNLKKNFPAAATKTFEVGTANGYSPVTVNATAGTFPADFTVSATQGPHPAVNAATSIQRYWTLTNTTISSADLTFQYLAGDVMGTEANYRVIRISGGTPVSFPASIINTGAHTASLAGVTGFSDWTVGENVAPTAAPANLSGRIITSDGAPLGGVVLALNGGSHVRMTITDASGYYSFGNVMTDQFYTLAPMRVNYQFSPGAASFSMVGNRADANFTATASAMVANPLDTPEFFVRQQYLDFLGREPDQGGLDFWTAKLRACGVDSECMRQERINVSAAFFQSDEFQQTGSFVYRLYKAGLGRQLSYQEFTADRAQVLDGNNLDARKAAFADAFVQRAEFTQKYQGATTAEGFADALIRTMLQSSGVDLSAQRNALVSRYNSGATLDQSRALALREAIESASFRQAEFNRAFVLTEYFGYLHRNVDGGGYDFWLDVLNNRVPGNYRSMVCAFITSSEYQRLFSSVVTHSNGECSQ
ncbi:MAG: hypothetical protein AUG51_16835 [Acidobacteria bacterium 13_1_20CM_3_53_8]|nr:MAG: hypothetical protein AUG51_16835 [Acidobacteria bacterium 13_1_20CM_3_53_8]